MGNERHRRGHVTVKKMENVENVQNIKLLMEVEGAAILQDVIIEKDLISKVSVFHVLHMKEQQTML